MVDLSLEALDEADARAQLVARRLTPVTIARPALSAGRRRAVLSVPLFARELHALVQAGLGLVESLEACAEKERSSSTKALLGRLLAALREGRRFSDALRLQGDVFPPLFIGIVRAAEGTGDLAQALDRYLSYAQRMQAVRQRVVSAAIYPTILLVVGTLVGLFLMGYVVPRFAAVYADTGRALPWGSRLLLDWGRFAAAHMPALLVALCVAAVALGVWVRSAGGRATILRLSKYVPWISRWLQLLVLSRLYLTLGLLLRGGLPVQQALLLSAAVVPDSDRGRLDAAARRIVEGWPLSAAFDEAGLTTPISLRFLRAGERSGKVAEMLSRAAEYHDDETTQWLERFSRMFEPLLMAAIGLLIGLVVILLYMPIFELAGALQ